VTSTKNKILRPSVVFIVKDATVWNPKVSFMTKESLSLHQIKASSRMITSKRPKAWCAGNEYELQLVLRILFGEAELLKFPNQD